MITAPKLDMPNKFAGHFPLSHLHNDMKTIDRRASSNPRVYFCLFVLRILLPCSFLIFVSY